MVPKEPKVCHLTTVHTWKDIRIFRKECCSLAQSGLETHLVALDATDRVDNGIYLHGWESDGLPRWRRMTAAVCQVYRKAREIDADLYHFHDPELIISGLLLLRDGKKVIYDVHEDVPRDILTKKWLSVFSRRIMSRMVEKIENFAARKFHCVIAATPFIGERFNHMGCRAVTIQNYPFLKEFPYQRGNWQEKEQAVCYTGTINGYRGIYQMIEAVEPLKVKLLLAGVFSAPREKEEVRTMAGWTQVADLGWISYPEVQEVLARSRAGLVLFHPGPNHSEAQPNKLFEYMAAGIPVIASDFPLWKEVVEGNRCGLTVNPLDTAAITRAIQWILDNPGEARRLGENGRKAVEEKYNWESESGKLIQIYGEILGD